jgi:hypothetical protein
MQTALETANKDLARTLEAAWESWLEKTGLAFDGEAVLLFCKALDDLIPPLKSDLFSIYFDGLNTKDDEEQGTFPAGLFR